VLPTILVVEDYDDTRLLLRTILESHGCTVLEAGSGVEAVVQAAKVAPDLILMDMSLPNMDGCQATRQIRGIPGLSSIPIIACTAHNQWEWRARSILAGCTDFIRKPIDQNELLQVLRRYLPESFVKARRTSA
jgi:CheY-like chemotaxis protein